MKEFIKQCLRDQEAINGIRQLYYLEVDPEGERKLELTIDGIIRCLNQFGYIPDEAKKKIIREQMVKDQDYDAMNSRTIWKWMNGAKDVWWAKNQPEVKEVKELEPLSEDTQKMISEHLAYLSQDMNFTRRAGFASQLKTEMEKIQAEDAERVKGKNLADFQTDPITAERKELHLQYIRENYDPKTAKPLPTWKEEGDWLSDQL